MTSTKEFSFTKPADSTLVFSATPFPLSIAVCSPRILRLRFGAAGRGPESSFVPEHKWPPLPLKIDKGPPLSIDSGGLVVRLAGDPQRLTLCDRAGAPRLQLALGDVSVQSGVKLRFLMPSQQHFYGLGEGGQPLDRLGVTRHIWNCHINNGQGAEIPIPLLLSYQGFGLFFDNTGPALVGPGDSNGYDWLDYGCEEGPLDLYYLGGDNMRDTLAEAAALLGRAPLPPRWALGYLQSTRHFDSSAELEQLPKTLREKRLPCDGLIFLSTYGEARGWNRAVGHLECEPSLIPQPARFFGELRAQHFHVITHEYPVLHEKSPLFAEAKAKQYVLDSGYPNLTSIGTAANYREGQRHLDFSRLEAREWWWRQHGDLARAGVDAWWLDGG
ncbi:MAG: hypothetical protein HY246_13105, partial [Proteobacteria bacterium]|nr:hypothetical protein [Pseudomonadota bacterium]